MSTITAQRTGNPFPANMSTNPTWAERGESTPDSVGPSKDKQSSNREGRERDHGRHHDYPISPKLCARLGSLAKQTGRSDHSLNVEAVERHTEYEEQVRSLVKDALAADRDIEILALRHQTEPGHLP
jgi:hypothetical protein